MSAYESTCPVCHMPHDFDTRLEMLKAEAKWWRRIERIVRDALRRAVSEPRQP